MERTHTETTYEINGTVYHRLEDVPEPHHSVLVKMLEDLDGDGVPDIVQDIDGNTMKVTTLTTSTTTSIHDLNGGEEIGDDELLRKI